jgi:Holliday junction resolvasome RuvABC DNA-binding subunit
MGLTLPLACADMWSLELLKGVSDTLALELIEKRYEIMRAAVATSDLEAIKRAHGIGEKTAGKLLEYLDLRERCALNDPYEEWQRPRVIPIDQSQ